MSEYRCDICHRTIRVEARGGPHPSPGDHDPAYHVAKAYGTTPEPTTHRHRHDSEPGTGPVVEWTGYEHSHELLGNVPHSHVYGRHTAGLL